MRMETTGCGWIRASADRNVLPFLLPVFLTQLSSQKDLVVAPTSQLTYVDHVCPSAELSKILYDSYKMLHAPDNNQNVLALCKVALQLYIGLACAQDQLYSLCIVVAVCSSGPLCQRSHNRVALLASFDNILVCQSVSYSHIV